MTGKKQLDSRTNIALLVNDFYTKVRQDDLLGPIFNNHINDWPRHMEVLTDFWETALLHKRLYKGNPAQRHVEVDQSSGGHITQVHFGRWLQFWFETIDDSYIGDHATLAKERARSMSTHLFLRMFRSR